MVVVPRLALVKTALLSRALGTLHAMLALAQVRLYPHSEGWLLLIRSGNIVYNCMSGYRLAADKSSCVAL